MREILKEISEKAILLGDFKFTEEQVKTKWLGYAPAKSSEIKKTEERLGIELPEDYQHFLEITNGFPQYNAIVASLMPVEKINYLKICDPFLIEVWQSHEVLKDASDGLNASILIGGLDEEQYALLVPPYGNYDKWGYWKFASWYPGEERYNSLKEYFLNDIFFMKDQINKVDS